MTATGTLTIPSRDLSFGEERKRRVEALDQARRNIRTKRNEAVRARVTAATVTLPRLHGQGVLVPGGYIITATHCIKWSGEGGMALGDDFVETVKLPAGRTFLAAVVSAEPVTDMAVLGAADTPSLTQDSDAFEFFAKQIRGVPLFPFPLSVGEFLPVQLLTHKGTWTTGVATRYGFPEDPPGGTLTIHTSAPLRDGTSGGPVVDFAGRLVGVVSWASETVDEDGTYCGSIPLAWQALPRWLADRIVGALEPPPAEAKLEKVKKSARKPKQK
jgi:S1-C subfamily serine protease